MLMYLHGGAYFSPEILFCFLVSPEMLIFGVCEQTKPLSSALIGFRSLTGSQRNGADQIRFNEMRPITTQCGLEGLLCDISDDLLYYEYLSTEYYDKKTSIATQCYFKI